MSKPFERADKGLFIEVDIVFPKRPWRPDSRQTSSILKIRVSHNSRDLSLVRPQHHPWLDKAVGPAKLHRVVGEQAYGRAVRDGEGGGIRTWILRSVQAPDTGA